MGLLSMITKVGVAKKVIDEGRKPANQAKVKALVSKARGGRNRPAR